MNTRFINPSGFAENLPPEQIIEDTLKAAFAKTAESFGYTHLETASVEYMDTLASKGDVSKEIYTIGRALGEGEGSSESARGLHFDLTVPFARFVAQHQGSLSFPFRRYQIQKVWRGERPQKGRFREFYQADIDVVGHGSLPLQFDAEVALAMGQILSSFGIGPITMHLNNRKFLSGLLERHGINTESTLGHIDKLDKIGEAEVTARIIADNPNANPDLADLFTLLKHTIPVGDVPAYLDTIPDSNDLLTAGKAELRELCSILAALPQPTNVHYVLDPAIARGLDYYTGMVCETTIDGFERYGSICSGGRYANLASRFTNQDLPGVGLSIGLTRLLSIITSERLFTAPARTKSDLGICILDAAQLLPALTTAQTLRSAGLNVELEYRFENGLGKQLTQFERQGLTWAVICEADGTFTLCNLTTQEKHRLADVTSIISTLKQ